MSLDLKTKGDTQIEGVRLFSAPPERVFDAHVQPDLVKQWMLGPPGWKMPICDYDARVGGSFKVAWANPDGEKFSMSGEFLALDRPHRIEHVERFHMAETTPDAHIVTTFTPEGSGTRMHMVITYPDRAARDAVLASDMAQGMEDSYTRLEAMG